MPGIPVTHRDCCSSVHIVTGHQREGKPLSIAFDALVKTGGTLVFLMGVSALGAICRGLLGAGMDPQTPAAVVERGATPEQRVTLASLHDLPDEAARRQVKSPAVIVVGKVVRVCGTVRLVRRAPAQGKVRDCHPAEGPRGHAVRPPAGAGRAGWRKCRASKQPHATPARSWTKRSRRSGTMRGLRSPAPPGCAR